MRKLGTYTVIAVLAAILCAPSASAFGLRIGPFHFGIPFFGHRHWRHHVAMRASPDDLARLRAAPNVTPALLYPGLAMPVIFQNIFWPDYTSLWPFTYQDILSTAFAGSPQIQDARFCQQPLDPKTIVARIQAETAPNPQQSELLQRLGGALGAASGYLAKSCPNGAPVQPIARLQLMQAQIEILTLGIDIIRQPLQEFEQSLDKDQRTGFNGVTANAAAADGVRRSGLIRTPCAGPPVAIDWSIDQIERSIQPTDAQLRALAAVRNAFGDAASDLEAHCPTSVPPTATRRQDTIEARLDATWRAILSIQVALASFEAGLSDEQKNRFDTLSFVAAR